MMITPAGAHVEMRQVGSSNIYESQDANYTQLDTNTMIVRTADGTQFNFVSVNINGEYRCNQIKDRNGNYISATYDVNNGHLLTVTDTLSRVITFAYDGNGNLSAVQQSWGGVTHNWATFYYGKVWIAPAFGGGLQINGPNNTNVTVLTQVSLHDGSSYTFEYNTAFGQVRRINHYESDGRLRNYTWYNMNTAAGQTDCPRFTEQHDWAEMWNNGNEAITYYSVAAAGSSSQKTMPDGTIYKEFFATTGWQTGLTTLMEVWSGNVRKKWMNKSGQLRTFEYDGHGRLWRQTTPEQGSMTFTYYLDDTLQSMTDARGAKTQYSYNPRHLLTAQTYDLSNVIAGQNVQPTSNATFGYDGAGNRTSMTDGLGSMSYGYDQLSRLTSETRTFTGVGSFTLSYGYNLGGELTSITNPWNVQVGYSYDAVGRPTSISGANYAGVSSYVNSISYRAFGIKQMAYGNGRTTSIGYDSRLRMTDWTTPGVM
jgi:YD repeat-containing protein